MQSDTVANRTVNRLVIFYERFSWQHCVRGMRIVLLEKQKNRDLRNLIADQSQRLHTEVPSSTTHW